MRIKTIIIITIIVVVWISTAIYLYTPENKEKLNDLNPLSNNNIEPDTTSNIQLPPVYHITGTITPKTNLNLELYKKENNSNILINKTTSDTIDFKVLEQDIEYTIKYSDPNGLYYPGEVKTPNYNIILYRIGEIIILDEENNKIILDTIITLRNLRNNFEYVTIKVSTPNNTFLENVRIQGTHNGGLYAVSVIQRDMGMATINNDNDNLNPLIIIPGLSSQDDYTFEYRLHGRDDLNAGTYKITITADNTFKRDMYIFWTG